MHKMIFVLLVYCIALTACGGQAAANTGSPDLNSNANTSKPFVDQAAEEKALREAHLAWSSAVAFMTDDGVTLSPNVPAAKGKEAIRTERYRSDQAAPSSAQ